MDSWSDSAVSVKNTQAHTRCGFLGWYPNWMQVLASTKTYVVIYGMIGMGHVAMSTYLTGTLTTIEKRFKIPSHTSGLISSSLEMGYTAVIICSYLGGQSHKSRWVAYGGIIASFGCFIRILPHLIYGAGQDAIDLAYANISSLSNYSDSKRGYDPSICGILNIHEDCSVGANSVIPTAILMVSQMIVGFGISSYWSLGVAYMDDNTRKDKIAILVSATAFIRMLGPTIGFFLASYSLEKYIDPSLKPSISIKDPRWVGAWWLSWVPLGLFNLALNLLMAFFPKILPRAAVRQKKLVQQPKKNKKSLKDFFSTVKRLLRNRILVLNMLSTIFYMFGMIGYWTFLPKYMESQFQQTASRANLVTGSVGLVFTGLGLLVSGGMITLFKPSARFLAGWNTFVETLDALGHYMFIFIGCPVNFHGVQGADSSFSLTAPCNAGCNCTSAIKYDPVCDLSTSTTFYSPCHAGCSLFSVVNNSKVFEECACAGSSATVISGTCPVDCNQDFLTFVILMSVLRFFSSSGRAGNSLLQFRCVSPDDKALSIGFLELSLILISFIPGPIVYGMLLDYVCIVWGETCGEKGNCWLYDSERLRFNLNITASTFLLAAACFDLVLWFFVKDLKLYDDDEKAKKRKGNHLDDHGFDLEAEELLVLRACQSPVTVKKSDIPEQ